MSAITLTYKGDYDPYLYTNIEQDSILKKKIKNLITTMKAVQEKRGSKFIEPTRGRTVHEKTLYMIELFM